MAGEPEFELGTAGASGRREHRRRKARRETAIRESHPQIGGLLVQLAEEPQHERAWASGASGEEMLAASLARRCRRVVVLHDRQMPESRANVDHIAIARSGVYVIDAKRYRGKIVAPRSGEARLKISGRNKTRLLDGLERQREAVRAGLRLIEKPVPVHACLCFLQPETGDVSGLPLRGALEIGDVSLLYPRPLAKRLNRRGEIGEEERLVLAEALAALFPPS